MPISDYEPHADRSDIRDRSIVAPKRDGVLFREDKFGEAAEVNEAFSIQDRKRKAIGDMVARDGDRQKGGEAIVDIDAEEVALTEGLIYIRGDVREVAAATLTDVPMTGDVVIGVRLIEAVVDDEDDVTLKGMHPGGDAEGEAGAARRMTTLTWGFSGDGGTGFLYAVYLLRDGGLIDQQPPPNLSPIMDVLAPYDFGAHKNYIVDGCRVTALGLIGSNQVFSVEAGEANILGYKRYRKVATRFAQLEAPDLLSILTEPQTFNEDAGTDTARIYLNRNPINSVATVVVTRQVTETVVRGPVAGTTDLLGHPSVTSIVSVVGYTQTTDYVRSGDRVSWAPAGSEPAPGASYDVTYQYLEAVAPGDVSLDAGRTFIEVVGGSTVVTNGQVLVSYTYRLPRFDRICLDATGAVVYVKGQAAIEQPQPPVTPYTLLSLCVVKNNWFTTPEIENDGVRSMSFEEIWRMRRRLLQTIDLVALERLERQISTREPNAKNGVFVDPFTSDRYRDPGEVQTGAVFNGTLQIPITPTFEEIDLAGPICLNYTEEVLISQTFVTGCTKINPYQAFSPLPARLILTPSQDFWGESQEIWNSAETQIFGQGNQSRVVSTEIIEEVETVTARFLRQITVNFRIEGFGAGEELESLEFDSVDVTPAGPLVANGSGVITGSFVIPANVTTGSKLVKAEGDGPSEAAAAFVGEGQIDIVTRSQRTTVQRFNSAPARNAPNRDRGGSGGASDRDPVAQSFRSTEGRHISSIEVKFCDIGNTAEPVIMELVTMDNGYPSVDVFAQTETDMSTAVVGAWHKFTFNPPVFVAADLDVAFVLKTNDADHAVHFAARGGYDAAAGQFIGAQPYTVGVRFSSSNGNTWTAHQDEDLTMRINAAIFDPTTKEVSLGILSATDMSDMIMMAEAFLPAEGTRIQFEIAAGAEAPVRIDPHQVWERQSYYTGSMTVKAILTGTSKLSPILGKDILAVKGHMEASGTYVTLAMKMGTGVDVNALARLRLPAGSTVAIDTDKADDDWTAMTPGLIEPQPDGTNQRIFTKDPYTATQGRFRITLTGTPAARPAVSQFRAWAAV